MADVSTLIAPDGVLYSHASVAPSPCKDYHQIIVTKDQVIFRSWRVSLRHEALQPPGESKDTHEDFLHDERMQSEIHRVFGKNVVDYVRGLASGHIDYLPRLPRTLLIRILTLIDLQDIPRISLVSKQFWKLSGSDDLWQKLFLDYNGKAKMKDLSSLAKEIGWRQLFFKSKLQLQVQLYRHMRKLNNDEKSGEGDPSIGEKSVGEDHSFGEKSGGENHSISAKSGGEDQPIGEKSVGGDHSIGEKSVGEDHSTGEKSVGEDHSIGEKSGGEDHSSMH